MNVFVILLFSLPGQSQHIKENKYSLKGYIDCVCPFGLGCPQARSRSLVLPRTLQSGSTGCRRKRSRIALNIAILQFPHLNDLQSFFFLMSTSSRSGPGWDSSGFLWLVLCCAAEVELQTGRLKAS